MILHIEGAKRVPVGALKLTGRPASLRGGTPKCRRFEVRPVPISVT